MQLKDQNFERSTFVRSNHHLTPCIIPGGKYVVTEAWRLLTGAAARLLRALLGPSDLQSLMYKGDMGQAAAFSHATGTSLEATICIISLLSAPASGKAHAAGLGGGRHAPL